MDPDKTEPEEGAPMINIYMLNGVAMKLLQCFLGPEEGAPMINIYMLNGVAMKLLQCFLGIIFFSAK